MFTVKNWQKIAGVALAALAVVAIACSARTSNRPEQQRYEQRLRDLRENAEDQC